MQKLITYLAKALVDQPDQVELREVIVEGITVFELKVAPGDVGKVIGRDGRTVNAVRTLLTAAAMKNGDKVRLEIRDDRKTAPGQSPANGSSSEPAFLK